MAILPIGYVRQADLRIEIDRLFNELPGIVRKFNFTLGEDSGGEPSILFRVVLTDSASQKAVLANSANLVSRQVVEKLQPYQNWGLIPYFRFRSETEQKLAKDLEWP